MVTGGAIALVMVGGGSFYAGTKYSNSAAPQARSGQAQQGGGQRGRFANGAGFVAGSIIAMDPQSITVQLGGPNASSTNNGSTGSKIVLFSASTQVGKFVTGAATDLKVGQTVMVQGNQNSDGSVTASSIQIRPAGSTFRGSGRDGN